jgi:hypothetical protein
VLENLRFVIGHFDAAFPDSAKTFTRGLRMAGVVGIGFGVTISTELPTRT